jgi:hypothetical protein
VVAKRAELVTKAAGKATVLKALAEHIRSTEPALVYLASQDDAAHVSKVFSAAGCPVKALSGMGERKLLGRRSDGGRDEDVVLLAGSQSGDVSVGIVVGANRDKLQLIQRLGQVVKKTDGGRGRFVVVSVSGADAADSAAAVAPHAARQERFAASDAVGLLEFLSGAEAASESDSEEG